MLKPRVLQSHTVRIRKKPFAVLSPIKPMITLKRHSNGMWKLNTDRVSADCNTASRSAESRPLSTVISVELKKPVHSIPIFIDLTQDGDSDDSSDDDNTPYRQTETATSIQSLN